MGERECYKIGHGKRKKIKYSQPHHPKQLNLLPERLTLHSPDGKALNIKTHNEGAIY